MKSSKYKIVLKVTMRRYQKKTERKNVFTPILLEEIKNKIKDGYSKKGLAIKYGIFESTIRKRLQ